MKSTVIAARAAFTGILLVGMVLGAAQAAGVDGGIITEDGQKIVGKIRWLPSRKEFKITDKKNVAMSLSPAQVAQIQTRKPRNIDAAAKAVMDKNYSQGVPALEKIFADYSMLQWDVVAARYLAEAYLAQNKTTKALEVTRKIMEQPLDRVLPDEFHRVYWDVLLEAGQREKLKEALELAARTGGREIAAVAQLKHGDIEMKRGNYKDALIDGYLRTVLLFGDVKSIQPEAHFKAAKCFSELGQHTHAEKMRKTLLEAYPNATYTQQLKSGVSDG